jgi:sporulation protein YlmC with PRC-barrel domain
MSQLELQQFKVIEMSREKKAMTKDRLIGMQVIDSDGNDAGTVQDIAFTVGKLGMTLIVETKKGENREVQWEEIQAAGDFVILKPSAAQTTGPQVMQPQQAQQPVCPTCKGPLSYIQQYQRWYCYKCQKYV